MLIQPRKEISVLSLLDAEIPGGRLLDDGTWGINLAAARLTYPDKGLKVQIPAWNNMSKSDNCKLYLGTTMVAQKTITEDIEVDKHVTLFVPPERLLSGDWELSYQITRFGQKPEQGPTNKLSAKLELPAGQDLNPDYGHSELTMAFEPDVVRDGVDKATAEAGVQVFAKPKPGDGALYKNAAVGDVLFLAWAGKTVESEPVTQEQLDDPEDNPIVVLADKATILSAGDSDGVLVSYKIRDRVYNESEDWCEAVHIVVDTQGLRLGAPILKQADGLVVDLDKLGDELPLVEIWAEDANIFKKNDEIYLSVIGTNDDGEEISELVIQAITTTPPVRVSIEHKNSTLRALAKRTVVYSYHVRRGGVVVDNSRSKSRAYSVIGEPTRLAAPIAIDQISGALDPEAREYRIRIPYDPLITPDNAIELKWFGARPDLTIYDPELEWYFPTEDEANDLKGFIVTVPGEHGKTLKGGTLDLSYKLLSDENGTITRRASRHASLLSVGEAQRELVKPIVLGEKDGSLEPKDLPVGRSEVKCPNPINDPTKTKDEVHWELYDADGVLIFTDKKLVNALNAGQDIKFPLDEAFVAKHFEARRGEKLEIKYFIKRFETGKTNHSNSLVFVIGTAQQQLTPGKVIEAIKDVLDVADAANGATAEFAANDAENAGHHYHIKWTTADGEVEHPDDRLITSANKGKPVKFTIPANIVKDSVGKGVTLSYYVELLDGAKQPGEDYVLSVVQNAFRLPAATFKEASGSQKNLLNPDDVLGGATVVIAADALLKEDDKVIVSFEGLTTTVYPHLVTAAQAGKELSLIKVPHAEIVKCDGKTVGLKYTVERKAGGTDGPSSSTAYEVRKVIGSGKLLVMGARYARGVFRESSASRLISAFNATTLLPVQAEWKYSDETTWTTAATWTDTAPEKSLQVRTGDDQITLTRLNIFGSGGEGTVANDGAFVALRDKNNVAGWGNPLYGAKIPATFQTFTDILSVACSGSSYAAIRSNNFTVAWPGTAGQGGEMTGIDAQNFVQLAGNSLAIAGRKTNGSVHAWGDATNGGTPTDDVKALTDVVDIIPAAKAFAALRATGQVVAWGAGEALGSVVPAEIGSLTDITHLMGNAHAFVARRVNDTVVAWGNPAAGGLVPDPVASLGDIKQLACANAQAFTALRATRQVVAWGNATYGAEVPGEIQSLTDVVSVVANSNAFAALRASGHIVAWPAANAGGLVPDAIAGRDDFVQLAGSSGAFAALCKDGTVVAWGEAASGGDVTAIADQLVKVRAIYDNRHGFTAITADANVVTWGDPLGGGDSSGAQDRLKGQVSYYAPTSSS
ncbi:RCC1 domain-containing protein [Pseudomonas atacamensis]|jgi:hypothetical protein|uniref:RCC1 domain-containing protein n=1 Tax=Pseudomonas atacamensis TaxID=2565368 RepID=UPI0037FD578C